MGYITDIIIAVLALAGTLIGSALANNKGQAVLEERLNNFKEDIKEDINRLSERVDKHNHFDSRITAVEESAKSAHKRLDEMRRGDAA